MTSDDEITTYPRFRLTIRHFEMLRALITHGSITAAAEALCLTQPAVTKLLASLEEELGIVLFERTARGIIPTPETETLGPLVNKLLDNTFSIQRAAWDLREGNRGSLTIVTNPALSTGFIPSIISNFVRQRPKTKISLRISPARLIPQLVSSNQVDLGVVLFPEPDSNTEVYSLPAGKLVCILPRDHPLSAKSQISPHDLQSQNFISFHPFVNYGRMIMRMFEDAQVRYTPVVEVETCSSACGLVRAGVGVGIIDEFAVIGVPDLVVRPLTHNLKVTVGVVHLRAKPLSNVAQQLIDASLSMFPIDRTGLDNVSS